MNDHNLVIFYYVDFGTFSIEASHQTHGDFSSASVLGSPQSMVEPSNWCFSVNRFFLTNWGRNALLWNLRDFSEFAE